jgi:hypothetical protein
VIRHLGKQATTPARARAVVAPLLAALLLSLSACSDDGSPQSGPASASSPSAPSSSSSGATDTCADVAGTLVAAVQEYVDAYGDRVAGARADSGGSTSTGDTVLQNALAQTRDAVARRGCDVGTFRSTLGSELDGVTARGPVARAVLLRLETSLTGAQSQTAESRDAKPGDDLPRVIAALAPGSTLRLAAGTYRLDETEVLLQGVTLQGAGARRTVLTSRASEAAFLVLTDGRVELSRLSVRHEGDRPAAGLIGGPTSSVVLSDVVVSGARAGKAGGTGGAGVLMAGRDGQEAGRGTTLEVTGSRFSDNGVSGILLLGRHRASIRSSRFDGNDQCGVCFGGASSGAVRTSRFTGNGVGVAALSTSRPAVTGNRFDGGQVGFQATDGARPLVRDNVAAGASRAAFIFSGKATGRIEGSTCRDVRFGIVVSRTALPLLGRNACGVGRSR